MKVLLKEDVSNLGYAGEIMDVADGYGRNYLIPQGLAIKATPGALKQAEAWRERAAIRMAELQEQHQALAAKIQDTHLTFTARAGETGKLYGSITNADIVEQLNETLGTEIDRRSVVGEPLRQLGDHNVTVRLSRDYQPQVMVTIVPFVEEEPEAEEVEEEAEIEAEVEEVSTEAEEEAEVEEVPAETEEEAEIEDGSGEEEDATDEEEETAEEQD